MKESVALAINTALVPSWTPDMGIVRGYKPKPPAFPVAIFGEFWAEFIRLSAEAKSCPPDYVAAGLMVSASALIGNSCWVSPWEGWSEPPILWPCAVGLPSSGKTPGLSVGMDLLRDLEAEINEDFADRKLDYETNKELAKARRDKWKSDVAEANENGGTPPDMPEDALEPEKPLRKRLMVTDATVEIMAPIVASNPKGIACFRDELSGWLASMGQYKSNSGGDRAFWLEAYNGKSFVVDRAKNGLDGSVTVPYLSISIVGGIQPEKLSRALLKDADDGMASRFLYFWPDSVPPKQPTIRPNTIEAKVALRRLRELKMVHSSSGNNTPYILTLSPDALSALNEHRQDLYNEERNASGLYLSHIGKNAGRALRLALVIEMMNWAADGGATQPDTVSEKSLLSALSLLSDYFSPMASRAFDNAALPERLRDAATIGKYLQRSKIRKISTREIQRARLGGLDNAQAIDAAVGELVEANWLRSCAENDDTGGRPRKEYMVNPEIWNGGAL